MSDDRYRHRWWGWGPEGVDYDMDSRPGFFQWLCRMGKIPDNPEKIPVPDRDSIVLPERIVNAAFEEELSGRFQSHQLKGDEDERLTHAYGRSYRDLARLRAGIVRRPPDLVVYPESHGDVVTVVELAHKHLVNLVAFGGGTNIVGSVEPASQTSRSSVTLDMRRMCRLLSIDTESMTADLEPGMFGPQIEEALNAHGYSLGHHPDSFVYSTLGGWLATRSAGTQSNAYGKIEDMVVAMTVVTPTGTITTKRVPAASTGPDLNRLLVGSEGTLGIITSATMRIHPVPEFEEYRFLLFPTFRDGIDAVKECVASGFTPSMVRLSDEMETELLFVAKPKPSRLKGAIQKHGKRLLAARGYRRPAAVIVAFEGNVKSARLLKREALRIFKRHRAFDLGTGPGEAWKVSRYDVPYLRDYLMDYGVIADSFETSTVWSNVMRLYDTARQRLGDALEEVTGLRGYVGCHISHIYDTGACLYYTMGIRAQNPTDTEGWGEQYTEIKRIVTDVFMDCGGALSHHHAVGYEHQAWVERELSETGLRSLRHLKTSLDPEAILNPGVLFPPSTW